MKKVLIAYAQFNIGGTEKFILDLIRCLPKDEYQIDLFLSHRKGDNLPNIPSDVSLVNLYTTPFEETEQRLTDIENRTSITLNVKQKRYLRATKCYIKKIILGRDTTKEFEPIYEKLRTDVQYDYAICVEIRDAFLLRMISQIKSDKKYVWVHMPFRYKNKRKRESDKYLIKYNLRPLIPYLRAYDKIICVSGDVSDLVQRSLPEFRQNIVTLYNPIYAERVSEMANEILPSEIESEKRPMIVTVGRVSHEKGVDLAIRAAAILHKKNILFSWYVLGYGDEFDKCRRLVRKYKLENCMYLIGQQRNPYPYIKRCDVYCQTSRFEAYSSTINEARILGCPIVATDFIGVREQVMNGVSGLIVPMKPVKIATAIETMLRKEDRDKYIVNVKYPNENEFQYSDIKKALF